VVRFTPKVRFPPHASISINGSLPQPWTAAMEAGAAAGLVHLSARPRISPAGPDKTHNRMANGLAAAHASHLLPDCGQLQQPGEACRSENCKADANFLPQQARFDKFTAVFNNERPHEALDMKCPAEVYQPSSRPYTGLPDIDYPFHDKTIVVTCCGRICLGRKKINFSTVFAGQAIGIKEVQDDIWLVSFMDYDLGYFDLETRVLEPLENPFGPKVQDLLPRSTPKSLPKNLAIRSP